MSSKNIALQKAPKLGGGNGVKAACGLVEQQHFWLMQQGAQEAQPLDRAGGESARLTVQRVLQAQALGQQANAGGDKIVRKMMQATKKGQILPAGEPSIKAKITAGVIAKVTADSRGLRENVVPG